jgi:Holliday junction resolvasome RuvABC endonuclease subunit
MPAPSLGTYLVQFWGVEDGAMLHRFGLFVDMLCERVGPEVMACEDYAMGGHMDAATIGRQAMMRGVIALAANRRQIPLYTPHPSTWRKTFIGFGSHRVRKGMPRVSFKKLCMDRCAVLGWNPPDHNAADAAGILDHVLHAELDVLTPWRGQAHNFLPLPEVPHVNRA